MLEQILHMCDSKSHFEPTYLQNAKGSLVQMIRLLDTAMATMANDDDQPVHLHHDLILAEEGLSFAGLGGPLDTSDINEKKSLLRPSQHPQRQEMLIGQSN